MRYRCESRWDRGDRCPEEGTIALSRSTVEKFAPGLWDALFPSPLHVQYYENTVYCMSCFVNEVNRLKGRVNK